MVAQVYFKIINSQWYSYPLGGVENGKVNSTIKACVSRTKLGNIFKGFSISFACKREKGEIDHSMKLLWNCMINNQISTMLTRNAFQCTAQQVTGHCGNMRGELSECACQALGRKENPQLRRKFEDRVIQQVVQICQEQGFLVTSPVDDTKSRFNMTIFGSGGLHAEVVLLIKLIDELAKNHFSGAISLFLIDTIYADSITKADQSIGQFPVPQLIQWDWLMGGRADLKQFLTEMALCLPPSIEMRGSLFKSAADYIWLAQNNTDFQHDLLIGEDIGDTTEVFKKIKLTTERTAGPGIALIKDPKDQPYLCEVNQKQGQFNCTRIS